MTARRTPATNPDPAPWEPITPERPGAVKLTATEQADGSITVTAVAANDPAVAEAEANPNSIVLDVPTIAGAPAIDVGATTTLPPDAPETLDTLDTTGALDALAGAGANSGPAPISGVAGPSAEAGEPPTGAVTTPTAGDLVSAPATAAPLDSPALAGAEAPRRHGVILDVDDAGGILVGWFDTDNGRRYTADELAADADPGPGDTVTDRRADRPIR